MPKISFIIPCYNLGSYLDACLESIKPQIREDVEFIFIDDGSSDNTRSKLEKFCNDNISCHYYYQENSGVSTARNYGLSKCKGDYVYLLDGDDKLSDNAIEIMLHQINGYDFDVLLPNFYIEENHDIKTNNLNCPQGTFSIYTFFESIKIFPTAPQLLYKKRIIEVNHLLFNPDIVYGEVFDFTISFLRHASTIRCINNETFIYVMRKDSATHSIVYEKEYSIVATIKDLLEKGKFLFNFSSYWMTVFQLFIGFSYYKYYTNKEFNKQTYRILNKILKNPSIRFIIKKIAFDTNLNFRTRKLALYIYFTKVLGYRLLKFKKL